MVTAAVAGAVLVLAILHLELALLTRAPPRALRVLMYHRVSERAADRATVTADALERQIGWLRARGYALVRLEDVVAHAARGEPLPERAVLLSFDDGTADARDVLLPVLRRTGAPAALFVVPGFAGSEREYDGAIRRFLSAGEMRELAAAGVGIGLHTFEHANLAALAPPEVERDVARCRRWLEAEGVPYAPALAFPYGAFPRAQLARGAFAEALRRAGIAAAFRIGNRVNALPLERPLEVQRTEIRGDEPFWIFAWKVWKGRRRAFA